MALSKITGFRISGEEFTAFTVERASDGQVTLKQGEDMIFLNDSAAGLLVEALTRMQKNLQGEK